MFKDKIDQYIDSQKENMLRDLTNLVAIDSTKGSALPGKPFGEGPARALEAMGALMEREGLKVTNYDNYVVTGDFGEGEKALDILAHLDVVPVSDTWTVTEPFTALVKDGKIYGRGTCDDKGPAIAALYAVKAIKDLGIGLESSLRLIFGSDEECGSSDLEYYYSKEEEAPATFTPDASYPLVNIEKARLSKAFWADVSPAPGKKDVTAYLAGSKVNVVPADACFVLSGLSEEEVKEAVLKAQEKTGALFTCTDTSEGVEVKVKGQAAHASTPEHGINAITAALELISILDLDETDAVRYLKGIGKLYPHRDTEGKALQVAMSDEVSGALTMNLGILNLENGVLKGEFDSRAPLCATDENLTEVMRRSFASIGMKMDEGEMTPAHCVPGDSDLVRKLLESYELYFHEKGEPQAIGGGTYVHDLKYGVAFGCEIEGVDTHMHGDDEYMDIDVMVMSAKIFADAIIRICGLKK